MRRSALGVDHQPAVVRADQPLHPDVAGPAVHLDLGNLRDDRLAAEGVGDAAAGEDVAGADALRRRTRVPAVLLRRRLEHGDRARALEAAVVGRAGRQQLQAELDRIGLRRRRQLVDERLGRERHLRAIRVAQVAGAQRRLPHERQADDVRGHAPVGDGVHVATASTRRRAPASLFRMPVSCAISTVSSSL